MEPAEIVSELRKLHELSPTKPALAWGTYKSSSNSIQYTVAAKQGEPIGLFHRITGALSSQGLQILSAEIHTQPGEVAWDRFVVEDPDYDGPPPLNRIESVCAKILEAVDPKNARPPTFRRIWKPHAQSIRWSVINRPKYASIIALQKSIPLSRSLLTTAPDCFTISQKHSMTLDSIFKLLRLARTSIKSLTSSM